VRQALRSASATAVLQGLSTGLGFAIVVLLGRFLGSSGYGQYALGYAWASFLIVPALLGFDRYLVKGLSVYEVEQRWDFAKGLLRRSNQLVLLSSLAAAGAAAAIAVVTLDPAVRAPVALAMLLVPLTCLTLLRQGTMQAMGKVVLGQVPEYTVRPVLIIVLIVALELHGNGALTATSAILAAVVGGAIAFGVGAALLRRSIPDVVMAARAKYATREWLRASIPMMAIGGIWMTSSYATVLLVGALAGDSAAGVYSVVQKGGELIVLVLFAANLPLAPLVARLYAVGDRPGLEHAAERMAQATVLVSIPIATVLIVFPKYYLELFGNDFHSGITGLRILAVGQLVNALAGPSGNVLLMTGHERIAMRGVLAGMICNLILAVALIPSYGVTGGAFAFASGLILWNGVLVLIARRRLGINVTALPFLARSRM
jgi:O-antigen/teichoic acid export membrane protein